jgi:plasmid stabilization system protein ParE
VKLTIEIGPRALCEARAIAQWYDRRRPGYGPVFRLKFDELLDRIADHPNGYESVNARYRRAFVRHFPIVVVYRVWSDRVEIIGVRPTQAER